MAGYVPTQFRAVLLEALAGRSALPTTPLYLGLATAVPDDAVNSTLLNITEVTTAGYERKAVGTFTPATTSVPVQIANAAEVAFTPLTADMTQPAIFAFLTTAASGTGAPIRYLFQLAEAVFASAGDPIRVPVNALIIE